MFVDQPTIRTIDHDKAVRHLPTTHGRAPFIRPALPDLFILPYKYLVLTQRTPS